MSDRDHSQAKESALFLTFLSWLGSEILHDTFFQPLECQIKIAADDTLFFYFYLLKKIKLDVLCESSALQRDSHEISSLIFP